MNDEEAEATVAAAVATFAAEAGRWPSVAEAIEHLAGAAAIPYYDAARLVTWGCRGKQVVRVYASDGHIPSSWRDRPAAGRHPYLVLPEWAHLGGDLRWPARAVWARWERLAAL
jgi:hypothetical protein